MRETNGLQIQEELKMQKFVTVPWLQLEYDLTYLEAKEFLRNLIERGWVDATPKGIRYSVQKKRLCLRKLRREEVDGLLADMTHDCVLALACISNQKGAGATLDELERTVHGDDDTQAAIRILTKHKLIYQAEEMFFLMVSRKTAQVLENVEAEKRRLIMRRKFGEDKDTELKKMFDVLFED